MKLKQLQKVGYEAGSRISVSIVVPGVILREIGLLGRRQRSAVGVVEDPDWFRGRHGRCLIGLLWLCRIAAENGLLAERWWVGLPWLIRRGPWVSGRVVSCWRCRAGVWGLDWGRGLGEVS